jgi:hypothetical protein
MTPNPPSDTVTTYVTDEISEPVKPMYSRQSSIKRRNSANDKQVCQLFLTTHIRIERTIERREQMSA